MTAPDTDTLIALAREGRIAVVSQWRWRHKNELSSWRGWNDGQPVVPFSEWNRDIYEWEERLSYVLPEGAPTLIPALLALIEERGRLKVERDEWRKDHADLYALYMARGKERDVANDAREAHAKCATALIDAAEARALAAEAKRDALREALALYRDAVRIDVQMDGPKFMGSNLSALKRAWEADRALTQETADVGE